jgi:mono/diheme cytochrome c family protein
MEWKRREPRVTFAILLTLSAWAPAPAQIHPEAPKIKPVDMTGNPKSGEKIYWTTCWTCHGLAGDGQGPASTGMKPPPTDFTRVDALAGRTEKEVLDAILKGKPGTAMYAQSLDPQSAVDVSAYVRTLARSPQKEKGLLEALARGDREAGRVLYNSRCWPCHGATGRGNGPAAAALKPPPADFTDPDKVVARTGARLYQALTSGVPGTAMAPQPLSEREKFDLIAYLRSLAYATDRSEVSANPEGGNPRAGKEIYDKRCAACHGSRGDGDGPAAIAMVPPATRFSDYEAMKDRPPQDWFVAIQTGVPGTAMYAQRLTDREAWDLVAYLRTLARRGPDTP